MLDEAATLCDELGMRSLLDRASGLLAPSAAEAVFRNEGQFWTIAYQGRMFRLREMKGLGYIASLLARPGREVHVLELMSAATGRPAGARARLADDDVVASWASDLDPLLDDQAKKDYGRRLADLEAELEQARHWGDTERAAGLEGELDLLTRELASAVGLRGRDRTFSSPAERARISVTKAIRTAISAHRQALPGAGGAPQGLDPDRRSSSYATPGAAPPRWSL